MSNLIFEVLHTLVFFASTIVPIICHLAEGTPKTELKRSEGTPETETKRSTRRARGWVRRWEENLCKHKPEHWLDVGQIRVFQMAQFLEVHGFLDSNETFSTRAWAALWTAAVTVTYKRPDTPTSIDDLTDSDLHFCKKKVVWEEYISDEDHEVWKFWGADKFESLEDFFRLEIKEWVDRDTIAALRW